MRLRGDAAAAPKGAAAGQTSREDPMFKFLGGTVLAIFLIGLLVVIGLLALIF
jgi:hypothetical protein